MIATEVDEAVDQVVDGQEALHLPRRLEALQLALASSGRLM